MEITKNTPPPPPPATYTLVVNQAELDLIRYLTGAILTKTAVRALGEAGHSESVARHAVGDIFDATSDHAHHFEFRGALDISL